MIVLFESLLNAKNPFPEIGLSEGATIEARNYWLTCGGKVFPGIYKLKMSSEEEVALKRFLALSKLSNRTIMSEYTFYASEVSQRQRIVESEL